MSSAIYDMRFAKPLDKELILNIAGDFKRIITIEDGTIRGGAGEAVVKLLNENSINVTVETLGIEDKFIEHGSVGELRHACGYDTEGILHAIVK